MKKTYSFETKSKTENLKLIGDFIIKIANENNIDKEKTDDLIISADEAATNIIVHAYNKKPDEKIRVKVSIDEEKIVIALLDNGQPINDNNIKMPEFTRDIETRGIGGLGIFLMQKFMDKVEYFEKDGKAENEVRMIKYLKGSH